MRANKTSTTGVIFPFDHINDRHEDNFHLEHSRPVLQIPDIMLYSFLHRTIFLSFSPEPVYLCPARNSGL
ncbi:hypothetical protein D3C85_867080 [compost metagenome]